MCMAIDAAIYITNKIIDFHASMQENHESFKVDFFKIHKLLYLAQGIMLANYDYHIFIEDISAHTCGVYVGGLDRFYQMVGIENISHKLDNIAISVLSPKQKSVLDYVTKRYGCIDRDELVELTKKHTVYQDAYNLTIEGQPKPIIPSIKIKAFFIDHKSELYSDFKGD